MLKVTIERLVLYQRNFRAFSGLFITLNQFQALAGYGLVFLVSGLTYNWLIHNSIHHRRHHQLKTSVSFPIFINRFFSVLPTAAYIHRVTLIRTLFFGYSVKYRLIVRSSQSSSPRLTSRHTVPVCRVGGLLTTCVNLTYSGIEVCFLC